MSTVVIDTPSDAGSLAGTPSDGVYAHSTTGTRNVSRWRPTNAAVAVTAVGVIGALMGLQQIHDNSFLTHLATGRLILGGSFPRHDPYSFTAHGAPWVVESWLPSVLYAGVERLFHGGGLLLLQGFLSTLLALLAWHLTRSARSLAARQLVIILFLVGSIRMWSPRPLMIGLLALGVTILLAEHDRYPAWWLAPLGWVWVNSHGSWPIGIGYLLLRLIGRRADRGDNARLTRLLMWAVGGACLGAVGPIGPRLLVFPLELLSRHSALSHVVEWRSPSFSSVTNLVFLVMAIGTLVLARRRGWEDVLPCAVLTVMALTALRNIPVAALVFVPVLARNLPLKSSPSARPNPVAAVALAALLTLGAGLTVRALSGPAYNLSLYPAAELDWMRGHGLLSQRVAAPDDVGNYRTFTEGAHGEVFMDDRFDMYPTSLMRATVTLTTGLPGWDSVLDGYRITAVLWPRTSPLAELLARDSRWSIVHRTTGWVVATRRA